MRVRKNRSMHHVAFRLADRQGRATTRCRAEPERRLESRRLTWYSRLPFGRTVLHREPGRRACEPWIPRSASRPRHWTHRSCQRFRAKRSARAFRVSCSPTHSAGAVIDRPEDRDLAVGQGEALPVASRVPQHYVGTRGDRMVPSWGRATTGVGRRVGPSKSAARHHDQRAAASSDMLRRPCALPVPGPNLPMPLHHETELSAMKRRTMWASV